MERTLRSIASPDAADRRTKPVSDDSLGKRNLVDSPAEDSARNLRILVIVNLPWDERLGACRVWMELAEQWRAAGHTVENYSLSDAFPGVRATRMTFALRQIIFTRKAIRFVRQNANRFDVIDALIGTLPISKEELGFHGLLVARSVGLYRLYDRFEESVARRWPRPPRGKFFGRFLYRFARNRLSRASATSLRYAELINLPNEEEATSLREMNLPGRLLVQPYGLTDERRAALHESARDPATRLAQKRVCFIGMWSARKGAYDWARIIQQVRALIPGAQFRFLGTMTDAETIRAELGASVCAEVELISDYQPDQLPALLADCTVGAFPSYVEGFGLAVLEQLAAGLPTVAYETAGPRDLLRNELHDLLVPSGDVEAFAVKISSLLNLECDRYAAISNACAATAANFSWSEIARSTVRIYRESLAESVAPIVFVQPFSIGSASAGGGARILRALLERAPFAWRSVCSSPETPKPWPRQIHLRSRPSWGRIEHSRLAGLPKASTRFFAASFRRRLREFCVRVEARALHAVPHAGSDFAEAHAVARDLALPFFISVHDDLAYTALHSPRRDAAMGVAWRGAAARFVISEELGREYCRRYGEHDFAVVTDGVEQLVSPSEPRESNALRIYFMGLFHLGYEQNLRALLQGIAFLQRESPSHPISLTLRCEHIRSQVLADAPRVIVLPFGDEAQVQRDMAQADLLYLPIPFGAEHQNFARYSLSTKMISYAGSGVPILYHGPKTSAAFDLLSQHNAAILLTSLEPAQIADSLRALDARHLRTLATNALRLAENQFMLRDQRRKFWETISRCLKLQ